MSNGQKEVTGRQQWRFANFDPGSNSWSWHEYHVWDDVKQSVEFWDYPKYFRRPPPFPRPTTDAFVFRYERVVPLQSDLLNLNRGSIGNPIIREGPIEYTDGYAPIHFALFPSGGVWADSPDKSSEADARDDLYRVIEKLSGRDSQTAASIIDTLKEPRDIIRRVRQISDVILAIKRFDISALKRLGLSNREIKHWKGKPHHVRMSSMWLTASFGILPALDDIHYACKVLNGEMRKSGTRVRVQTGSGTHRAWGSAILNSAGNGPSLESFGILNVSEITWEILPFSFVVDYVWNVGGFLKAIGDTQLMSEQQYGYSYRITVLYRLQRSRFWESSEDPILGVETQTYRVGVSNPPLPLPWRAWSQTLMRFFNAFSVLSTVLDSKSRR